MVALFVSNDPIFSPRLGEEAEAAYQRNRWILLVNPDKPQGEKEVAVESSPPSHDIQISEAEQRFLAGDSSSLREVYWENVRSVSRVIMRMGVNPHDVDDLVQTTFLEALRSAEKFAGRSSFRSWLLGIAINQTRLYVRGKVRSRKHMEQLAKEEESRPASAEQELSSAQDIELFREALAQIPELQREALVLCEIEGLSGKEVAQMLDVPVATIWRRVHDGKVSMRKQLAKIGRRGEEV
jgi:RNA polymerase sigma-70 factor, ECF subfamily